MNIQPSSQTAKQLNTEGIRKLGNFKKTPEELGIDSNSPAGNQKPYFPTAVPENVQINSIKDNAKSIYDVAQTPWNLNLLKSLVFQKLHLILKLIFRATDLGQRPEFDIFLKALFCIKSSRNLVLKTALSAAG